MSIKFLVLGGGCTLGFGGGGGERRFYFYGREDFSEKFQSRLKFSILTFRSENSRRLWLFLGSLREFGGKFRKDSGKFAGKIFPNREML